MQVKHFKRNAKTNICSSYQIKSKLRHLFAKNCTVSQATVVSTRFHRWFSVHLHGAVVACSQISSKNVHWTKMFCITHVVTIHQTSLDTHSSVGKG